MELGTEDATMMTSLSRFAVSTRVATTLDEVLDAAVVVSLDALSSDSVYVCQLDSAHGQIIVHRRGGVEVPRPADDPNPDIRLIADYPSSSAATIRTAATGDPGCSTLELRTLTQLGFSASLNMPIVTMERVWGGIWVARTEPWAFDPRDVATAEVIATMAGAAINRLEYHRDLQRLAHTDPMTGLANRRVVDTQLEAWASDPQTGQTMTVVLFDVNGLKAVNDTYGHASGDQLIRDVANLVGASAGRLPGAVAARIGGDEFLLASPDSAPDVIASVVDDLTAMAALLPMGGGVSCGSACGSDLTRVDDSPTTRVRALLRMADSEQYRNKMAGHQGSSQSARGGEATTWNPIHDPAMAATTVRAVTDRLRTADDPMEVRVWLVASALCEIAFGAAWWVSRMDPATGTIRSVHCGTSRADSDRDGAWTDVILDPTAYSVKDFPATAHALEGHSFYVDRNRGEPAEQRLLNELGFSSLLCSGGVGSNDSGDGWLIEVYGDALTPNLDQYEALLHVLTVMATEPRLT